MGNFCGALARDPSCPKYDLEEVTVVQHQREVKIHSASLQRRSTFLGIDQTGATGADGAPKPLPVAFIEKLSGGKKTTLHINRFLMAVTPASITTTFPVASLGSLFVIVDSVLGIPRYHTRDIPLRTLFQLATSYSLQGKAYGALVASSFFHHHVLEKSEIAEKLYPRRLVEVRAKANSIFLLKPFQRNVGCGTFRVWKELGLDDSWFTLWPFEIDSGEKARIAEGYPSFLWKSFIKAQRGDEKALMKFIKLKDVEIVTGKKQPEFESVDHMDAAVLALFAAFNQELSIRIEDLSSREQIKEGWIYGVPFAIRKE